MSISNTHDILEGVNKFILEVKYQQGVYKPLYTPWYQARSCVIGICPLVFEKRERNRL